ncbi:hypothetical protein JZ751_012759 [Albula glossodonta]|uniref:Uncharacterized protein n=1 Tax=Albula glossodonta TaxID=121402 RepID=A0A8T2N1N8_9TELE|nr:hypothetical protein JZ751_012759 [Albula glossodonta]
MIKNHKELYSRNLPFLKLKFVFRKCLFGISRALTCNGQAPPIIPAWMATPVTTARSGSTEVLGSFPKKLAMIWRIRGILVEPPTRTTSSTSDFSSWPSSSTVRTGARIFWKRSALSSSNISLVMVSWNSTGLGGSPEPPASRWRGTCRRTLDCRVRLSLAASTACLREWMSSFRMGNTPSCWRTLSKACCSSL